MSAAWFLKLFTIGLPIIAALILRRWGSAGVQRRATAVTLTLVGLSALVLFLIESKLGLVTVPLLSLVLLLVTLRRKANDRHDYSFYLLLNSAWAVIMQTNNWVLTLFGLSMLLIVASRWSRARGSTVGFVASRDDYGDDWGPK